jgi:L-lactate dehydrogenase complex protein LldF
MQDRKRTFLYQSEKVAFDLKHRHTIRHNISRYDLAFQAGLKRYDDLERAKCIAAAIKRDVVKRLPDYLVEFEKSATDNGMEVIWCESSKDALESIAKIVAEEKIRSVVKSKSMTTEELDLNEALEGVGVEAIETDLGEFIVQKAGEKPYHILTPAMHKSKEDVADLFHKLYQTPEHESPEGITAFVRHRLRKEFEASEMGISGANFLIAREGAMALTENEGNGLFTISYPRVHLVIAGIEKILPSVSQLNLIWPLLAAHGTGQQVSVYNSLVYGPRKSYEQDGPERMIVLLLDNGRSQLYSKPHQSESLACIRCGACLNGCPIYKNIGGYTYDAVYSGPIGSVITPHLKTLKEYGHLSFASSLCGRCYEVCPVKINLPQLLLYNRQAVIEQGYQGVVEKVAFSGFSWIMSSSFRLKWFGAMAKRLLVISRVQSLFGTRRSIPDVSTTGSFHEQWLNKKNTK